MDGRITIDPFVESNVNPNSYNLCVGDTLVVYNDFPLDSRRSNSVETIQIPESGYVLKANRLYLANSVEVLGSDYYAPTFNARSSVARLGIFVNLSASLCDIGFKGQLTMQLFAAHEVRIYPYMKIAQMMFWSAKGEISLYRGKYQGSRGAQASRAYQEYLPKKAVAIESQSKFYLSLSQAGSCVAGKKFTNLARIRSDFNVPPALLISRRVFQECLRYSPEVSKKIADQFEELKATAGCFIADNVSVLEKEIAALKFDGALWEEFKERLEHQFGPITGLNFAVRSCSSNEDSDIQSMAGIYASCLNVSGYSELREAIVRVLQSYYSYSAVVSRIRGGDFSTSPEMDVIVQLQVEAEVAGVGFSHSPSGDGGPLLEWVNGTGDQVVSGEGEVHRYPAESGQRENLVPGLEDRLLAVLDAVQRLCVSFGQAVDVEWAWDKDRLYILQVRPITVGRREQSSADPILNLWDLYGEEQCPQDDLGSCREVCNLYVQKRGPANLLARQSNVATGLGLVVRMNGHGLQSQYQLLEARLAESDVPSVILDLDNAVRQIIVEKSRLIEYIRETYRSYRADVLHTFVVRDFIAGEYGFLSEILESGDLLIEGSSEGLLAINRGLADCNSRIYSKDEIGSDWGDRDELLSPEATQTILRFNHSMNALYGNTRVEWVCWRRQPYFIDFSLGAAISIGGDKGNTMISSGLAKGPVFDINEPGLLGKLSVSPGVSVSALSDDLREHAGLGKILKTIEEMVVKPIVLCDRPYAALSYLIPHAAGFIFRGGSLLCHLSILIREAGLPAVICPDVDLSIGDSSEVFLSNGAVHVVAGEVADVVS